MKYVIITLLFALFGLSWYTEARAVEPVFNLSELETVQKWNKANTPQICPAITGAYGAIVNGIAGYQSAVLGAKLIEAGAITGTAVSPVLYGAASAIVGGAIFYAAGYGVCTAIDRVDLDVEIRKMRNLKAEVKYRKDAIAAASKSKVDRIKEIWNSPPVEETF